MGIAVQAFIDRLDLLLDRRLVFSPDLLDLGHALGELFEILANRLDQLFKVALGTFLVLGEGFICQVHELLLRLDHDTAGNLAELFLVLGALTAQFSQLKTRFFSHLALGFELLVERVDFGLGLFGAAFRELALFVEEIDSNAKADADGDCQHVNKVEAKLADLDKRLHASGLNRFARNIARTKRMSRPMHRPLRLDCRMLQHVRPRMRLSVRFGWV